MKGEPHSLTASDHVLADNGLLHDEVLRSFREIFAGHPPVPLPELP